MASFRFGTSGWTGILGEDFTFENLRILTQALADQLTAAGRHQAGVVVGHDGRFMGERFAREVARVLAGARIKAFLWSEAVPAPALVSEIERRGAACGLQVTAGSLHHEFNGLRLFPGTKASGLWKAFAEIESRANAMAGEVCYREMYIDEALHAGLVEKIHSRDAYLESLRRCVNFGVLGKGGLTVAVNPFFGTSRGYLVPLLREAGVAVRDFNDAADPCFGGLVPDPVDAGLEGFKGFVHRQDEVCLGLALDPLGERFGVVDGDGTFLEPDALLALLCDYLARSRAGAGKMVARTPSLARFIDPVCRNRGLDVEEIHEVEAAADILGSRRLLMAGLGQGRFVLGGHAGLSDGILASLLVVEMRAAEGQPLGKLLAAAKEKYTPEGD